MMPGLAATNGGIQVSPEKEAVLDGVPREPVKVKKG